MGKRLGEYTRNNTKCMVEVNGTRLIDRMIKQLAPLGLDRLVMVVGYHGRELMEYLGNERYGLRIEYVENPVYDRTNNIYSLALAKEWLRADDTILLESDLIFDDTMLSLLLDNPQPNLALVAKYESWMDGTMVRIDEDLNIVNFVPKAAFRYEETSDYYKTVNIYKFSREFLNDKYIPFLDAYMKALGNNEYYENVLRIITFLGGGDLKALPVGNVKWYEIDDKQDLDIAEAIFADEDHILRKYYGRYGGFWRFPAMLDFCYLVNPYFSSSRIIEEMQAFFPTLIAEYPSGMKVNSLLASKCWGVAEKYIVPGNGAAELIKALMEILPGTLGIVRPTFEEYPNRRDSATLVTFTPDNPFFTRNRADTIMLINPDNPSGNFIPKADVLRLAGWCADNGVRLVVDESFVDFSEGWRDNSLLHDDILEAYPTMAVMKSISKSYGVPGIRLGILCSADEALIARIKKMVSIWNINSFAEYFMQIFTKYEKDYFRACDKFIAERNDFEKRLREIPFLRVIPSQANYFLCEVKAQLTAREIVIDTLKRHDILLRDCSDKGGLNGGQFLRIAVRDHADNSRLIEALKQFGK